MATRQIFRSEWRLAVDQAWRQKLLGHIQRAFASKPKAEAEAAKLALLGHPYLLPDPAGEAERTHQRERYERCKGMLEGLKERLARGTIKQLGLEGTTGQASLTVERLSNRPVRLLDLSDDWLLVALERHPQGTILVHHWLYSRRRATVHLLHVAEVVYVRPEAIKVQRGDGPWTEPGSALEDDFNRRAKSLLGEAAMASLRRLVLSQDSGVCGEDEEVIAQCEEISGIPYRTQEAERRQARESGYRRKYGPPTLPPGIGFLPDRMRLDYVREKRSPGEGDTPL